MYEISQPESFVWTGNADIGSSEGGRLARDGAARVLALRADASGSAPCSLGQVWEDLVSGRSVLVSAFSDEQRCYAIFRQVTDGARRALRARDRELVEHNLLGESEKVLAYDRGVSISTVAGRLSCGLRSMGLESRAAQVPILVSIAVHAFHGEARWQRYGAELPFGRTSHRLVSAPRPDLALPATLTLAEQHVVRLLIEGSSHAQIALARNRSERTIANQLASAFQKLGVSGRRPLLSHLIRSAPLVCH